MSIRKLVPSLGVSDIDRSLEFYRRNFGFEAVSTHEEDGRLVWCCLRSGDTELMLQQLGPASPASPPGAERPSWVLYLSPPDIRALHRRPAGAHRLRRRGVLRPRPGRLRALGLRPGLRAVAATDA